jgi:hypothetical protein
VKQLNSLATGYVFDAILLYGDAGTNGLLQTELQTSPHYAFNSSELPPYTFHFVPPPAPASTHCF